MKGLCPAGVAPVPMIRPVQSARIPTDTRMFLSLTFDGALSIQTKTRDIYVSRTVPLPPEEELAPSERAWRLFGWVWISSPRAQPQG